MKEAITRLSIHIENLCNNAIVSVKEAKFDEAKRQIDAASECADACILLCNPPSSEPVEKTVKEWLEELPEPYRSAALKYAKAEGSLGDEAASLPHALNRGFSWINTEEKYDFWVEVCKAIRYSESLPPYPKAEAEPESVAKTVDDWLQELPEPYRSAALKNAEKQGGRWIKTKSQLNAIFFGFLWGDTEEGHGFWVKVRDAIRDGKELPPYPKSEPEKEYRYFRSDVTIWRMPVSGAPGEVAYFDSSGLRSWRNAESSIEGLLSCYSPRCFECDANGNPLKPEPEPEAELEPEPEPKSEPEPEVSPVSLGEDPNTPPEGFILYGVGPLKVKAECEQRNDVARFCANTWHTGFFGVDDVTYALRAGSEIAHLNGLFLTGEAPNETEPSGQPFIPGGWPEGKITKLPECPPGHAWRFVPVEEHDGRRVKEGSVSYYAAQVRGVWQGNYTMTPGCGLMYIESVPVPQKSNS